MERISKKESIVTNINDGSSIPYGGY